MDDTRELPASLLLRLTALRELFGGFAHEIAQPLNAIIIAAQVIQLKLQQSALPDAERDFFTQRLDLVTSQVHRATEIVDRLRSFSHANAPKTLEKDLKALCNRLFDLMRQQFVARGIDVNWNLQQPITPIPTDVSLVEGAIVQALAYARDSLQAMGEWHEKRGLVFKKVLNAKLMAVAGRAAFHLDWLTGELPPDELPFDPDSLPGLIFARQAVDSTGGRVETTSNSITVTFGM